VNDITQKGHFAMMFTRYRWRGVAARNCRYFSCRTRHVERARSLAGSNPAKSCGE